MSRHSFEGAADAFDARASLQTRIEAILKATLKPRKELRVGGR